MSEISGIKNEMQKKTVTLDHHLPRHSKIIKNNNAYLFRILFNRGLNDEEKQKILGPLENHILLTLDMTIFKETELGITQLNVETSFTEGFDINTEDMSYLINELSIENLRINTISRYGRRN